MPVIHEIHQYCPTCQTVSSFHKTGMNHAAHLAASVLLCGFWIPVWIILAVDHSVKPYRCSLCDTARK